MSIEERLWERYTDTGQEWRYRLYFVIAYLNDWWLYTSSFERWTVRVTAMLVAVIVGLALARLIGG